MTGPEPTLLLIAEVVYGIAAISSLAGMLALVRAMGRKRSGAVVNAQVIRSARRIEVEYVVNGVAYVLRGTTNYNDAPSPGSFVPVCYTPSNPENAKIVGENYDGVIAGVAVGFVFALLASGLLWFAYQAGVR